jgi:hypothetical protein
MYLLHKNKWFVSVISLVVMAVLLSVFLIPASPSAIAEEPVPEAKQIQEARAAGAGVLAPPDPVPGEIFEGNYLRVGINHGGTLGVTEGGNADPGIGFQWAGLPPLDNPTESLAIWWWGEGFKIAYKEKEYGSWVDTVAFYQPSYGWPPPPATNIVPVSHTLIRDDDNAAVKVVKVRTADRKLLITFTFTLLKEYPELNLETTIQNLQRDLVRDIVYTRIVDWDVCQDTGNMWASTDHAAYAWDECEVPDVGVIPVQLTVAGHDGTAALKGGFYGGATHTMMPLVNYVDLNAWDDQTVRKPNNVTQSFVPIEGDNNAGIYYKIGELTSGSSATVYTIYQSNFPPTQIVLP